MKKKKTEPEQPQLRPGDTVEYDGEQFELVSFFGEKKQFAVINGDAGRFSTEVKRLTLIESAGHPKKIAEE